MKTIALIAFGLLAPLAAQAQMNLATLADTPNRVHLTTGAEYGIVAGGGYGRVVPFLDRLVVVGAELTLPVASLDLEDLRLRASGLVPIVGAEEWKLAGSLAADVRSTATAMNRMTNLGAELGLAGGYYARHWFAGLELGLDWAMTSHIAHTEAYRARVYAGAVDGWYASPGGNLRAGLQAGLGFAGFDLVLRAGRVTDVAGAAPLFPFYATLTVAAGW